MLVYTKLEGLGFVEVPSPEQYHQIPEPYIKYDKPVYTTSVTHQLHCLYMIVRNLMSKRVIGTTRLPHGVSASYYPLSDV
jgi:hypothetical protein